MTSPHFVLYSPDATAVEKLREGLTLPYVSVAMGYGREIAALANVDAMWATPMVALELFGVNPPFPLHRAQVLPTRSQEVARGYPPFFVVGVAIGPNDPREPRWSLHLIVSSMLDAIKSAREERGITIERIALFDQDLFLHKLPFAEAQAIIDGVYRNA